MMKYDGIEFDKIEDLIEYQRRMTYRKKMDVVSRTDPSSGSAKAKPRRRWKYKIPFRLWSLDELNYLAVLVEGSYPKRLPTKVLRDVSKRLNRTVVAVRSKEGVLRKKLPLAPLSEHAPPKTSF